MEKELIDNLLQNAATKYSQSPATTNAGRFLRFIAKIVPVHIVVKMFAHKLSK
jgi:hypothetical protein